MVEAHLGPPRRLLAGIEGQQALSDRVDNRGVGTGFGPLQQIGQSGDDHGAHALGLGGTPFRHLAAIVAEQAVVEQLDQPFGPRQVKIDDQLLELDEVAIDGVDAEAHVRGVDVEDRHRGLSRADAGEQLPQIGQRPGGVGPEHVGGLDARSDGVTPRYQEKEGQSEGLPRQGQGLTVGLGAADAPKQSQPWLRQMIHPAPRSTSAGNQNNANISVRSTTSTLFPGDIRASPHGKNSHKTTMPTTTYGI